MSSPITMEISALFDPPSPKRQKVEETTCDEDYEDFEDYDSDVCDSDEYEAAFDSFNEEYERSQGFEMDFSKLRFTFGWKQLDLDRWSLVDQSQSNRELMVILAKEALSQRKVDQEKCLELGEILRANYHPSAGITYYISFLINDLSDANQPKSLPYRAMVQHHVTGDIIVHSFDPKPPSSP